MAAAAPQEFVWFPFPFRGGDYPALDGKIKMR
jgi:hypothetical protein